MSSPEAAELEAVDAALAGRDVAPEHAELAELARLLRDDRPEPDPGWATQLDRRVAAGFPARPRRRRQFKVSWVAWPATIAASILLVVVVVSADMGSNDEQGGGGSAATEELSGGGGGGDSAGGGEEPAQATREMEQLDADAGMTAPAPPSPGDPRSDGRQRRAVERAAQLTLAAPRREIDRVASRAGNVAADLGGFVASSAISSRNGGDLHLRVPTARLDTAIQRLSRLGRVRGLSRTSRDITSVVVSAREGLNDARAERESLLRQLAAATTLNETESIRARLRIVSREIARARSRLRSANNRAGFADIQIALVPAGSVPEEDDEGAWTPADAFDDALRVLEVAAGVAVIALALLIPLLVAAGLGWIATRGVTRRRRERALDMA
jgi:Domain of unknown function (DUF4349)